MDQKRREQASTIVKLMKSKITFLRENADHGSKIYKDIGLVTRFLHDQSLKNQEKKCFSLKFSFHGHENQFWETKACHCNEEKSFPVACSIKDV